MKVLVGCESSGVVRRAFAARGHEAWSCDLLPSEDDSPMHLQCCVRVALRLFQWDCFIVHPTCRFLSVSGLHWNTRQPWRAAETDAAVKFAVEMAEVDIPRVAMENPIGCLSSRYRKPDQIIQPYNFGEDASKATCLWLKGLPKLQNTGYFPPRVVNGKNRWSNQTDSGQNRLGPSPDRWKLRSKTYQGIADAMAAQWGMT